MSHDRMRNCPVVPNSEPNTRRVSTKTRQRQIFCVGSLNKPYLSSLALETVFLILVIGVVMLRLARRSGGVLFDMPRLRLILFLKISEESLLGMFIDPLLVHTIQGRHC